MGGGQTRQRVRRTVEVFGALREGDCIVTRATDELREGINVNAQAAAANEITPIWGHRVAC
jgi:hypothetical protein